MEPEPEPEVEAETGAGDGSTSCPARSHIDQCTCHLEIELKGDRQRLINYLSGKDFCYNANCVVLGAL